MSPSTKQDSPDWEVVKESETGKVLREPPVIGQPPPSSEASDASASSSPIHPLAATLLIVVDSLWLVAEWNVLTWILTIPLSFFSVFIPTTLIQRYLHGNSLGKALAYGMFLGVLAAVPTPILSTSAGIAVLAWSGLSWLKKGAGKLTS